MTKEMTQGEFLRLPRQRRRRNVSDHKDNDDGFSFCFVFIYNCLMLWSLSTVLSCRGLLSDMFLSRYRDDCLPFSPQTTYV